ncbi:hypothetical protein P7C70_g7524, partial [Phenoliferia sp. Uapishka_3]
MQINHVLQPARRPLIFPSEILHIVVQELDDLCYQPESIAFQELDEPFYQPESLWVRSTHRADRNSTLLNVALVCRNWSSVALDRLYVDLRIDWKTSRALLLLRTLRQRPELLKRVRLLDAFYLTSHDLATVYFDANLYTVGDDEDDQRPFRFADSASVPYRHKDDRYGAEFTFETAQKIVESTPDGPWMRMTPEENGEEKGSQAFWSLVSRLPNLQCLTVEQFEKQQPRLADEEALEKVLGQLVQLDLSHSNEYRNGGVAVNLLPWTPNIRQLYVSTFHMLGLEPPTNPNPLDQLRHLHVSRWYRPHERDASGKNQGDYGYKGFTVLDLAMTAGSTLESLTFAEPFMPPRDYSWRPDNESIGGAIRRLPNLRLLSLSSSPPPEASRLAALVSESNETQGNSLYPASFLDALASSKLRDFRICDGPTKALLDALPQTITSITFYSSLSENHGELDPIGFSAKLDSAVALIAAAKSHLPELRLVFLNGKKIVEAGEKYFEARYRKSDMSRNEMDEKDTARKLAASGAGIWLEIKRPPLAEGLQYRLEG